MMPLCKADFLLGDVGQFFQVFTQRSCIPLENTSGCFPATAEFGSR
jgi:hypothetical protein